jgi:hypothetical protein
MPVKYLQAFHKGPAVQQCSDDPTASLEDGSGCDALDLDLSVKLLFNGLQDAQPRRSDQALFDSFYVEREFKMLDRSNCSVVA